MYEVELKYRIDGKEVDILKALNKKSEGKKEIYEDVYFTHSEILPLESSKELRVRRISSDTKDRNILTYKSEIIEEESGSKNEFEVLVDNSDNTTNLLKAMGFKIEITFTKECINWLLPKILNNNNMLVSYVKIPEINDVFLEIEITINENNEIENALKAIKDFTKQLKLNDNDIEKELYTDVVRNYRKRKMDSHTKGTH